MTSFAEELACNGFAILPQFLTDDELALIDQPSTLALGARGGQRNILDLPAIKPLAYGARLRSLVEPVLGARAIPVRALLFDKTPQANWNVAWHQDLTVAVQQRQEAVGYGPWSTKAGVTHVQPPVTILEQMLAIRVHIDPCGEGNGPLRVLPGSHCAGKINEADIPAWRQRVPERACLVPRGGVLLMRPLLLHASSAATDPGHRRVVHIEYAACSLAGGLQWRWPSVPVVGAV